MKLLAKNLQNWIFGKKWPFFDTFWPKNPQFWIFPRVPLLAHASRHLGEDFRKFSAKTNDKNWSYKSKTLKNWIFGKNGHFSTLFGQKNPQIWIFLRVPLLIHASRHLGEEIKKFSAKTNDKNWIYKSKTFKKTGFLAKLAIFWHILAKKIPHLNFPMGTTTQTR